MNYAKVLGAALTLFPKKVKVKLIDAATGTLLHKQKIPAQQLPAAFNKPTILEINNINWRVLKANPVSADDFLITKKLTLHVQNAAVAETGQLRFGLPTICHELPAISAESLYHDFTLALAESDWRQIEFLPLAQWQMIADEIGAVEVILGNQPDALLGYEQQYIREKTAQAWLSIPLEDFCRLIGHPVRGNIFLGNTGFVEHGIALRSDNYLYYGLLEDGNIRHLCITEFDGVDDEFMKVLDTWKLVLTDWCNASTLSAEPGEEMKVDYIGR